MIISCKNDRRSMQDSGHCTNRCVLNFMHVTRATSDSVVNRNDRFCCIYDVSGCMHQQRKLLLRQHNRCTVAFAGSSSAAMHPLGLSKLGRAFDIDEWRCPEPLHCRSLLTIFTSAFLATNSTLCAHTRLARRMMVEQMRSWDGES